MLAEERKEGRGGRLLYVEAYRPTGKAGHKPTDKIPIGVCPALESYRKHDDMHAFSLEEGRSSTMDWTWALKWSKSSGGEGEDP